MQLVVLTSVPEVICQKHLGKLTVLFCFTEVRHEWHAVDCKEKQKDVNFQRIYNLHAHVKCLLQKLLTFVKTVPLFIQVYMQLPVQAKTIYKIS